MDISVFDGRVKKEAGFDTRVRTCDHLAVLRGHEGEGKYMRYTQQEARRRAQVTAQYLRRAFSLQAPARQPSIAVFLDASWRAALRAEFTHRVSLLAIPGFRDSVVSDGDDRQVGLVEIDGKTVFVQRGCIAQCEAFPGEESVVNQAVRLQVETALELGIETFVIADAVTTLMPGEVPVGHVAIIQGFCALFAPPRPVFAGENPRLEDALRGAAPECFERLLREDARISCRANTVCAMLRGPDLNLSADRMNLRRLGIHVVGTGLLPAVTVAATRPGARVLVLGDVEDGTDAGRVESDARVAEDAERTRRLSVALTMALRAMLP